MNENDRRSATELSLPVPSYYRFLIDSWIYFSNQKQPFHEVHQSFTKARDRQIVVSAWQRPGGIPALAVIPLKCDFILPSIIFNQSYSMISLHFFRNRSRLEMVREGPVGFSLALCSFLLDKSWRKIGPRMSTTRSVPVWIHSSKAAGIKGTFPGTNVRRCQMFFSCYNFDLLVLSQKNSLSNFLVGDTNSQRESLGASAVSRPCFLTCRNKEARFGTRIPESIEGKQKKRPSSKKVMNRKHVKHV